METEKLTEELCNLADSIWDNPEIGFCEFQTSDKQIEFLKSNGFSVMDNLADIPTAFCGSFGSGKPVIGLLGEIDALPEMSQKAGILKQQPVSERLPGHGCGHHLLGVGAIAAALAIKDYLLKTGKAGKIIYYGCPAEEKGSGKAFLARAGFFNECDVAFSWHPSFVNTVCTCGLQSCIQCNFKFTGVSAHSALAPHVGRSALDGLELMNIGVNFLREHIFRTDNISYSIIDAGGPMPNVIPSKAEGSFLVRSKDNKDCQKLFERLQNIAKGAALMTGTTVEMNFEDGLSNLIPNFHLEDILIESFNRVEKPLYTEDDLKLAKEYACLNPVEMISSMMPPTALNVQEIVDNVNESPISTVILKNRHSTETSFGSSDVGDVSWIVPTAIINTACFAYGTIPHSWQLTAQGKTGFAHKGMLYAGRILADASINLIENPDKIVDIKNEFLENRGDEEYKSLIPDFVRPHRVVYETTKYEL